MNFMAVIMAGCLENLMNIVMMTMWMKRIKPAAISVGIKLSCKGGCLPKRGGRVSTARRGGIFHKPTFQIFQNLFSKYFQIYFPNISKNIFKIPPFHLVAMKVMQPGEPRGAARGEGNTCSICSSRDGPDLTFHAFL